MLLTSDLGQVGSCFRASVNETTEHASKDSETSREGCGLRRLGGGAHRPCDRVYVEVGGLGRRMGHVQGTYWFSGGGGN